MELNFNKTDQNVYEAIFEATADFNIHLERKSTGILVIKQSGIANGAFDDAFNLGINAREVIDYDFGALVYPKYIKVVSGSEVVSASVNFNEGGGSGNGSDATNNRVIYYKTIDGLYQDSDLWQQIAGSCVSVRKLLRVNPNDNEDKYYILPSTRSSSDQIVAVCFLPLSKSELGLDELGTFNSIEEYFEWANSEGYPLTVDAFVEKRITEEEFYNLND